MNERDSEIMAQLIGDAYSPTRSLSKADVVVVNTCSIREKAEQKAFSMLGRLRKLKKKNPSMVIAVAGCVAQQEGRNIRKRMPHVDIVIGPQNLYRLPELIADVKRDNETKVKTDISPEFVIPPFLPSIKAGHPFKRFVTIMQGCNNFCTYCVVPYTRGREISRDPADIIDEITHLVQNGIREVTLIGQNVNSYGLDRKNATFPDLLRAVAGITGIERIRFTTSHPKDLSEDLMRCFAEIDALCPHIHLPVQAGSNSVLKRMNRKYTLESYLDKVSKLKNFCPDIVITTDIIVGFPGETDEDFDQTMQLLETVRYHGAYSFKYSDRPQAPSCDFPDKAPEDVKRARLKLLQSRQEEITVERHNEFVGRTMPLVVEGRSKSSDGRWCGRTDTNHVVNFTGADTLQPGRTVQVVIEEACLNSLRGRLKKH